LLSADVMSHGIDENTASSGILRLGEMSLLVTVAVFINVTLQHG
jgi:hypothetical protein